MDIPLDAANSYGADIHAVMINCAVKNSACDKNAKFVIDETDIIRRGIVFRAWTGCVYEVSIVL